MVVDNTALYQDIQDIFKEGKENVHFRYNFTLRVGDEDIEALAVLQNVRDSEYSAKFAEETLVEVVFGMGTYNSKIVPNKSNLKGTLVKETMEPVGDNPTGDSVILYQEAKCTLANLEDANKVASGAMLDVEEADRSEVVKVVFQLTNGFIDDVMTAEVGGIFRNVTVKDIILTLLSDNLDIDQAPETKLTKEDWLAKTPNQIVGVDLVEPDNTKTYEYIWIPPGTTLYDLIEYLQEEYGVYDYGISSFIQRGIIYVYPKYKIGRHSQNQKVMSLSNVPANRMPGVNRTFVNDNGHLKVIATDSSGHIDATAIELYRRGNGFRSVKAENLLDSFTETSKGVSTVTKQNNVIQDIVHKADKEIVFFTKPAITDNLSPTRSMIYGRGVSELIVKWENSDHNLVYPGMPVLFLYLEGEEVKSQEGVINACTTTTVKIQKGISGDRHKSDTDLRIHLPNTD